MNKQDAQKVLDALTARPIRCNSLDEREASMSGHEHNHAIMESERIGAWDSYSAARPTLIRDPQNERLFCDGFDRGRQAREGQIAELEAALEAAQKDAARYRYLTNCAPWDLAVSDAIFSGQEPPPKNEWGRAIDAAIAKEQL